MFIVVKTELSNGFEYPEIETFRDEEEARKFFNELVLSADEEYADSDVIISDDYFFADSGDMKGNGIEIQLLNELVLMNEIMEAVDKSRDTYSLKYKGEKEYVKEVPCLYINEEDMGYLADREEYFCVTKIIKRPYDYELPGEDDYVYDVVMDLVFKGDISDLDCEAWERMEYIDTLDNVDYEVLLWINKHMWHQQ